MPSITANPPSVAAYKRTPGVELDVAELVASLREDFGIEFSIWDGKSAELLHRAADQPEGNSGLRSALVTRVATGRVPEIIDDADSAIVLAIPVEIAVRRVAVAIAALATRRPSSDEPLQAACRLLGCEVNEAREWFAKQPVWSSDQALRLARSAGQRIEAQRKATRLAGEVEKLSQNLTNTYEEICLLYGVTQNLHISSSDEELGRLSLEWLIECLPARGVAIQFLPVAQNKESTYKARTDTSLLTAGDCPVDDATFSKLVEALELSPRCGPLVVNDVITSANEWHFPTVHQLVIVPLAEGDNIYGWLAAFNHTGGEEFGTVEANLLNSVGAILGIHSGNRELYRQQAEFLANVVRALTSAIDAKDPYTCGHSDRVARIAVRLARELRCSSTMLNTLYMAGLLHDIGKIGIDDNVLRKPGRLTDAEFEHIKLHPELGYKILADLKQLSDVLPVVLHHHEQWDGGGYPQRLQGESTPFLARITAVADAFDAMTSDRPYRKGMSLEKVEEIFRAGAGKQWDPTVIEAYFRCRDDIAEISRRERANLSLDVEQWRD